MRWITRVLVALVILACFTAAGYFLMADLALHLESPDPASWLWRHGGLVTYGIGCIFGLGGLAAAFWTLFSKHLSWIHWLLFICALSTLVFVGSLFSGLFPGW